MSVIHQPLSPDDHLEDIVKPPIYSKVAILAFSILFSVVFGGILLMQNLKDIGRKKEANRALLLSIGLTALTVIITIVLNLGTRFLTMLCSLGAGYVLIEVFYKKYFPNDQDYEKKKIWKPLVIAIIICIILIGLAVFSFWAQDQH